MPQIELEEQDLIKVDQLVKAGLFSNRNQAIRTSLENLLQLSNEDIKNMEKAKHEASMFLEIYMGNMLYPGAPAKIVINGKEMYKIPVKSVSNKIKSDIFYVYIDPHTMEVDVPLLIDLRSLPKMSKEELEEIKKVQTKANMYCENKLDDTLVAGIPLKDAIEGEECFRLPLIGEHEGKANICGYLFLDVETLDADDCVIFNKHVKDLKK